MSDDNITAIYTRGILPKIANEPTLEGKIREAFRLAQDFWLGPDKSGVVEGFWLTADNDLRMHDALVAVMLQATEDDKERIERSMNAWCAINAALAGVPVELVVDEFSGGDVLPIMAWWEEAKRATP